MSKSDACIQAITAAGKGLLSEDEIIQVAEQAQAAADRAKAVGGPNVNDRVRAAIADEADKTAIAAAIQRKQAALNVIVRDRVMDQISAYRAAGLSPRKSVLAVLEGSAQGVPGARKSVFATRQAFETRYLGGLNAAIAKDRPHLYRLIDDREFNADVVREMYELREGGSPGRTQNPDAQWLARQFATFAEMSRTDLNRLGASIGRLDGWAGPQSHDAVRMLKVDRKSWVQAIRPLLDLDRTFPDVDSVAEADKILEDVYLTIVTGRDASLTANRTGDKVGPANMAKSLSKARVLHFRDADAWLAYRDQFGGADLFGSMVGHLRRQADAGGIMQVLGPNPEAMLRSIVDQVQEGIRNDGTIKDADKTKQIRSIDVDGELQGATSILMGTYNMPSASSFATIASTIRSAESMAKLGGATISSLAPDTVTAGLASMFRGSGFWKGIFAQLDGIIHGRPKGEQAEISYLLGEGFDGVIGHAVNRFDANDGVPGAMAKASDTFFRMSGLTWWTDVSRAAAARTVSAELGMRASKGWEQLPPRFRHVLDVNGISAAKWEAIRTATRTADNGNVYITPDLMRGLDDSVLEPFVAERMAGLKTRGAEKRETARQGFIADARLELELDLGRLISDETSQAVLEPDAKTQRFITAGGTQKGTVAGEAARFMTQFKSFSVAAADRLVARSLLGGAGATKRDRFVGNLPHLGALVAGTTITGYLAMIMKDTLKGKWPPRDPGDPKTWLAAAAQGGGAGIYGDFLFGQANRFGNSALENIAGPVPAAGASIVNLYMKARDGDGKAADVLNIATQNTPFINLWYARPALDALILNHAREWASPGFLARQNRSLKKETGQQYVFPR